MGLPLYIQLNNVFLALSERYYTEADDRVVSRGKIFFIDYLLWWGMFLK